MKISIIVPIGRPDTASATILSILGQSYCPDDLEIICVGAALTPISAQFDDSRIRYVHLEQRRNPAQTRMAGVAQAAGDIYLFVDDDIELDSHVLEQFFRVVALYPDIGAVGARLPCIEKTYFSRVTDLANFWSQQSKRSGSRNWLYSAVLAVPAKVYHEVGGFVADLAIGEDVDLTTKIRKSHYVVMYEAAMVGYHNHRRTSLRSAVTYFWNNGKLAKLYLQSKPQLRCFRIWIVLRRIVQWSYNTVLYNREQLRSMLLYLPGIVGMYAIFSVSHEYHYYKFVKEYIRNEMTSEDVTSRLVKDSLLLQSLKRKFAGEQALSAFFLFFCHCRELLYLILLISLYCFFTG